MIYLYFLLKLHLQIFLFLLEPTSEEELFCAKLKENEVDTSKTETKNTKLLKLILNYSLEFTITNEILTGSNLTQLLIETNCDFLVEVLNNF